MKKKVAIILALVLAISTFALTACGGKDKPAAPASDGSSSSNSSTEAEEPTIPGEKYEFGDNTVFVPEGWTFSDEAWEDGKGPVTITYDEVTYIEIEAYGGNFDSFDDMVAYYNEEVFDEEGVEGKIGKNAYVASQSHGIIAKDTISGVYNLFVSKTKSFKIVLHNDCPEENEDKLFEDIKVILSSVK